MKRFFSLACAAVLSLSTTVAIAKEWRPTTDDLNKAEQHELAGLKNATDGLAFWCPNVPENLRPACVTSFTWLISMSNMAIAELEAMKVVYAMPDTSSKEALIATMPIQDYNDYLKMAGKNGKKVTDFFQAFQPGVKQSALDLKGAQ